MINRKEYREWIMNNILKVNFIWWVKFYTSTELTRLWINYRTLQWDKYVRVFGNKYIIVKDIVDKFLFDNWITDGNKKS